MIYGNQVWIQITKTVRSSTPNWNFKRHRQGYRVVQNRELRGTASSFMLMENSLTTVHEIDPLRDLRWQALIDRHPNASVFQTTGWLEALRLTYGYEPVAFTTSPPS